MAPRHSCHWIRCMLMCPCIINDLFESEGPCYRKLSCWTEQEMTGGLQKSCYQPDFTCHNLFSVTNRFFTKTPQRNTAAASRHNNYEHPLCHTFHCLFPLTHISSRLREGGFIGFLHSWFWLMENNYIEIFSEWAAVMFSLYYSVCLVNCFLLWSGGFLALTSHCSMLHLSHQGHFSSWHGNGGSGGWMQLI